MNSIGPKCTCPVQAYWRSLTKLEVEHVINGGNPKTSYRKLLDFVWALGFVSCDRDTKISEYEEHAGQAHLKAWLSGA